MGFRESFRLNNNREETAGDKMEFMVENKGEGELWQDPQETETMNEDDLFADRSLLEEMSNAAKQLLVIIWVFLLFISVDLILEFCEKFFCKVLSKIKRSNEDVEEINKKKID